LNESGHKSAHASSPSEAAHKSVLALEPRTPLGTGLALAVLFHVIVLGAALYLPQIFDRPHPPQKPIIARLVALGKPRDHRLLPRKQAPLPAAAPGPKIAPSSIAPAPPSTPSKTAKLAPAPSPAKKQPSRQELMERALARAAGHATPPSKEKPDPEREGSEKGSPEGTATTAEEGDAYFTAVHDAILENYVVPSVISERERLYLTATVLAYIGAQGQILRHEFQKKSGNAVFDQALELAIQRTKLPPPPDNLAKDLRDSGVLLNFKP
jgi:outer membrane biosynthesis protein TonB